MSLARASFWRICCAGSQTNRSRSARMGDIRADRRTDAGVDGGARADHSSSSRRCSSGGIYGSFPLLPVTALAAARPVGRGRRRMGSKAARAGIGSRFRRDESGSNEKQPVRAHGEAGIVQRSLVPMPSRLAHAPVAEIRVRKAERADLDALIELEHRVFATDRLSRRSLRRFLKSPTAELIVAEHGARLAGNA